MEEPPKRIALIVSAQSGNELKAGHSDVSTVYSLLTDPQFGGCTNTNPPIHGCTSRNTFLDNLSEVLEDWNLNNQFVFYFSGHGEIKNDNYCLKFGKNYLPFGSLMNEIKSSGVKRAILIIDACHSGAALEGVKNDNHPSQQIDEESIPKGITVIASSQKSQTSHELKDGSFSVFTKLFCEGIQSGLDKKSTSNGYISIADIINYINNKLNNDENYSEFHQRPIYLIGKADGEIWISKNKSGKISKQIQPKTLEPVISSEELRILFEQTEPSKHPCMNASIQNIDWDLIKKFIEQSKLKLDDSLSPQEVLSKLDFYSPIKLGGQYWLHKAAVLCFYNRPDTIFNQARSVFTVGNTSDSNFISEDVCGSLSYQVTKLIEKTKEYLQKISFVDDNDERHEIVEIDLEVIRELISNAIAHRDYSLTGMARVSITSDCLEVQNPGNFRGASWNELLNCKIRVSSSLDTAVPRNLRMLKVFEGIGRGFKIFKKYIDENGSDSITCIESNIQEPTICIRIQRTGFQLEQIEPSKHPCVNASIKNIDWDLIKKFIEESKLKLDDSLSPQETLSKLDFYSPIKFGGQYWLHKAAVLCFYNRPDTIFNQARSIFTVGNTSDSNFISEDVCGSLSYQLTKLIEKTKEYLQRISFIDGEGIRREVEDIDLEVIIALISNAIVHRDYSLTGMVRVSITSDYLEVQNPGNFRGASWNELLSCATSPSSSSDAAISRYLRTLKVFEGIGRGFKIFNKYIQKNGSDSITCIESNIQEPTICIRIQRTKFQKLITSKSSSIQKTKLQQLTTDKSSMGQEMAGIAPAFKLEKYAEGLREQYGNLKLESLDTTGVYYNELKLWKIFIPQNLRECQEFIPQVYELPKDRARLLQENGQLDALELAEAELENHRKRYVEQPIRGVFEVLGDPKELAKEVVAKYAVILGDPGSGKSTLLQYLALIWAERPVQDLPLYPLPLLLELRTYARDKQTGKCKDIISFIHTGYITCRLNQQDLQEKLNRGDAIALFDGIDEVFDPALRDEVVTDIHRFRNEYPAVRAIVTSRWLGYKAQRLRDAGFRHFMLQELNDEQMQDFVVRWHDLNFAEGADKDRKRERLQKANRESRSIKELAGNPLLLTMMAILNRNQELPRDRPELYNQASRVLLHQWDIERTLVEDRRIDPKMIDYRDKQAILRKVAYYMQSSEKGLAGNSISAAQLESILTDYLRTIEVEKPREITRIMIGQLRTRNFILCDLGGDSYGFVHRTFLEYFCAWEFVWQFKEEQTLTIEQLINDVFGNHWQDESWHEVLRLISGMIEPRFVADIIDFLLEQKVDKSEFLDERDRLKKEGLSNLLLAVDCFVEVRNRNLIAATSSKLLKILQHEAEGKTSYKVNYELANRIINNIASIWQDSSGILDWLKDHALNDENEYVRRAAVQEIAKGWKDDPQTFDFLCDRAIHDPFKREKDRQTNPRQTALEAILEHYRDNPQTLELLKAIYNNDPDEKLKEFAKKELAKLSENSLGA